MPAAIEGGVGEEADNSDVVVDVSVDPTHGGAKCSSRGKHIKIRSIVFLDYSPRCCAWLQLCHRGKKTPACLEKSARNDGRLLPVLLEPVEEVGLAEVSFVHHPIIHVVMVVKLIKIFVRVVARQSPTTKVARLLQWAGDL